MNGWSVKTIVRQKRQDSPSGKDSSRTNTDESGPSFGSSANFVFDFQGGIKLIIPRNPKTSDAIADGELKTARQALAKFAEEFVHDQEKTDEQSG